jgi:hypothetical protein
VDVLQQSSWWRGNIDDKYYTAAKQALKEVGLFVQALAFLLFDMVACEGVENRAIVGM